SVSIRTVSDPNVVDWSWRWSSEPALPFADPASRPSYTVCLHDRVAGVPSPVLRPAVPTATDCPLRSKGNGRSTRYRPKDDDGARRVSLRSRGAGGRFSIRGRSQFASPVLPFHVDTAVTVQLNASNGNCWEARFETPARNDDGEFKATVD